MLQHGVHQYSLQPRRELPTRGWMSSAGISRSHLSSRFTSSMSSSMRVESESCISGLLNPHCKSTFLMLSRGVLSVVNVTIASHDH